MNPAAYNMPQMAYPDAGSGHPPTGPPPPGAPHHPMSHPGMPPNGQPNYDPNYSAMGGGHPPPPAGGHPMHPDYHHQSQSQGIHPQPQTPQDVHPMPMSNWFEPM